MIEWDQLSLPGPDRTSAETVHQRAENVLRPTGALQRLDALAVWLAAWQRTEYPRVDRSRVVVFAGDHGVASEQVSAYPASVTAAMVDAIESGVATVSVMAREVGADLTLVDVGMRRPSGNIRVEPALTPEQFRYAFETGSESVRSAGGVDLLVPGEVGIGNTTPASAICHALFGGEPSDWVGRGTGLDDTGLQRKREVVASAVARTESDDPLDVLRDLGGWELAAIAGAVYRARLESIPVLLDGFVVTAAVMPMEVACPGFLDHCWPAHVSAEPGHRRLVTRLGKKPILDLEMRLGEATGALAALPVVALAARSVVDVATFDDIGL